MAALTEPAHHVRIGHTTYRTSGTFPMPVAMCLDEGCPFITVGEHVRADGVHHATDAGHIVLVAEGRTLTAVEGWLPCARLATDGGVCGNDEQPVCTAEHLPGGAA